MTAYLNPKTPAPVTAAEGSLGEFNPYLKPIITDASEAYRALKLRLPNGEFLYSEANNKMAKWMAKEPLYMLWPEGAKLINIGSAGPRTAVLNGAASPTIVGNAFEITATNQAIATKWKTRTNGVLDPLFESASIVSRYGVLGSPAALSVKIMHPLPPVSQGGPGGEDFVAHTIVESGATGNAGIQTTTGMPVGPAVRVDAGMWVYTPSPISVNMYMPALNAEGGVISTQSQTFALATGWNWITMNKTTPALTASCKLRVGLTSTPGSVVFFYVWGMMLELGRTTPIEAAEQFPRKAELASGAAAYVGTAGNSQTDTGPFARNAPRSFVMGAYRSVESAANGFFAGGAGAVESAIFSLRMTAAEAKVQYGNTGTASAAFTTTAANGLPTATQHTIALTQNAAETSMFFYLDGVSKTSGAVTPSVLPPAGTELWLGIARGTQWQGKLGPIAVYGKQLTAAELLELN